jgi:hypothetical protein
VIPLALDTETALIGIGQLAPPLTCATWAYSKAKSGLLWVGEPTCRQMIEGLLDDQQIVFVGLHTAYDMAVIGEEWPDLLPRIFDAYASDRITDIGLRQKLIDIAHGKFRGYTDSLTEEFTSHEYSIAALAERFLFKKRDKDTHRLGFGVLRDVRPEDWPPGAAEYAIEDAQDTIEIFGFQEPEHKFLDDQFRQTRGAFGLHLISCWGIRTSEQKIDEFQKDTEAAFKKAFKHCKEAGFVRPDGTRDTKIAKARMVEVMAELQAPTKKTDAFIEVRRKRDGHNEMLTPRDEKNLADPLFGISIDEEACLASADDSLIAYSQVSSLKTVVEVHIPALRNGIEWPIQPRFEPLVETGRTSCKGHDPKQSTNGYQLHNVRRLPGIRECFTARPGKLFVEADYSGLELHTWAQTCLWALGESELAKALNAGTDPHLVLAATMLDTSYENAKARYKAGDEKVAGTQGARQFGKIGNFGFQGGMSAETFRAWARIQYKTKFSQEQADHIRASWYSTWPESEPYFRWIKAQCAQAGGYATITQFQSNRVRGLITFTIAANTFFQGLGADATKAALFAIQRECYVEKWSPLYGCRMVNFVHDSYCLEVPEDLELANAAAKRLVEVMIEEATKWLPDVPPRAEVTLSKHWSKKAKAVKNEQGLLIPWEWSQ